MASCLISVDVSNWDEPGVVYGKTAKQCTKEQTSPKDADLSP